MRTALAIGSAAVLALVAWTALRSPPHAPEPAPAPRAHAPTTPADAAAPADTSGVPLEAPDRSPSERRSAQTEPEASPDRPQARLVGRLVDPGGAPVVAARVLLGGRANVWPDPEALELVDERWKLRGVETSSAADGSFELSTQPSDGPVWLRVEPADDHDLFATQFGGDDRDSRGPLVRGSTDLGTLTLLVTGSIAGTVRDADGSPIAEAAVRLDGVFPGGRGRRAHTDEAGRYTIRSVPPGTYPVEALLEGWLTASRANVAVAARRATEDVDFALRTAPTIRGRVLDEAGRPLAVRIGSWPVGSGQGAFTRSNEDGRFTLSLPQDEPYRMDIRVEGFRPYGGHFDAVIVQPGTDDLEIVLERLPTSVLAVVDAESGVPVETYEVTIETKDARSSSSTGIPRTRHGDGRVQLSAEPSKTTLGVIADGYVPWEGPLGLDAVDGVQTVRLERGAAVRGRVLANAEPVQSPTASIAGARIKLDPSKPDKPPEERWFSDGYGLDVGRLAAREREVRGEPDGTFRIDGLAPGTYELTVSGPGGAPLRHGPIRVAEREELDLGDLSLPLGGRIEGLVLPPPGTALAGIEIELGFDLDRAAVTDGRGRFAFDYVPAGTYAVGISVAGRRLRQETRVQVDEGRTSEVTIDLAAVQPSAVRIRASVQGRPVEGVRATLFDTASGRQVQGGGRLDAEGALVAEGPPQGTVEVRFQSPAGAFLGVSPPVACSPGGRAEVEVDLPAGTLELVLPPGFRMPEQGHGSITLDDPGLPREQRMRSRGHVMFRCAQGGAAVTLAKLVLEGTSWDLGPVAPGTYVVQVHVGRPGGEGTAPARTLYEGEVKIEAGRRASCALELDDGS